MLSAGGCGHTPNLTAPAATPPASPPEVGVAGPDNVVVKARAALTISTKSPSPSTQLFNLLSTAAYAADSRDSGDSGGKSISVTNAPNTSMTLSSSNWSVPAITNALLDFGHLDVSGLFDNNLNVCGDNGHKHCGTALFRMYTTGAAGAGIWNSTDQYGAPITAGPTSSTLVSVGLDTTGAATVQSISIPASKHTLRLSDFSPAPSYEVKGDFTDAGAGDYGTTIVLEYALAQ